MEENYITNDMREESELTLQEAEELYMQWFV